jgi:hypothetical protein
MRHPAFLLVAAWFTLASAFSQLPTYDPPRKWTVQGGTSFDASVVSFDGTTVTFRTPNGSRAQAPLARLSADDGTYLADWQKRQPIKVVMPDLVGVDTAQLKAEVVSEDPVAEKYVYRTQHFEFESQGKFNQSLLREVGRSFEATYELVKALPWGIEPRPETGDYFRARLLKDKASYHAAGGPPNSGGVYLGREEKFLVPFENIGVKTVGKSYAKTEDFETHTIVHELTHQMMHASLQLLPQWIVEGTAEYTGILPLKVGRFRVSGAKTGLKDYVDFLKTHVAGGVPEPYPLEPLFGITNEQWNSTLAENPQMSARLYFTSYLLVYYFMHLDGKGDGQNFVRYFREVSAAQKDDERYRRELAAFKKLPGVETLPDGRYRWRSDLTPPKKPAVLSSDAARDEFQKQTLKILLNGRTEAELMKQIRSAYARLAIRV